ncbi:MAG: tetratricopeptide repeat protein [Kofleriaceae bacterium]
MIEDRQIEALLEQADTRMRLQDWRGAIDLIRRALAVDPLHARGHAILAIALLGAKRLEGAAIEAESALALDGDMPFCHYAAAAVRCARRELAAAWEHCQIALQNDSLDVATYVLAAEIQDLRGNVADARSWLGRARELQPDHTATLTALARLELTAHNYDQAAEYAAAALRSAPEDVDANVVAGLIDLVRGDDASAEQHARFALGQSSTDRGALRLWCAIRARRSPLLGIWWRFNAWISLRRESQQVAMLLGSFVIAQIAVIVASAFDLDTLEAALRYAWLGLCAYTWIAPVVFRRMLEHDLGTVTLDPEF